ncbi:hypothetical protein D9V32_05065 [Mycetocola tolaasinivorans]|uniref:Uncharacterized protein n=1 Tax=Mycetocola tolaasinivorans TaxID=76635 RepID=A0A3L7A9X5_9MICO|nr:hypothetical protein [Mycetocola tolaasinivorans]RLP76997.1 hypothetical protein D9V32_05065 [Mycetocola tolaasinivorans]
MKTRRHISSYFSALTLGAALVLAPQFPALPAHAQSTIAQQASASHARPATSAPILGASLAQRGPVHAIGENRHYKLTKRMSIVVWGGSLLGLIAGLWVTARGLHLPSFLTRRELTRRVRR